jgi:hypothetical protein
MPKTEKAIDDREASMTLQEFCAIERMSMATYAKIRRLGYGPEETIVPGLSFRRITPEARRTWHAKLAALQRTEAAEVERKRRTVLAMRAGNAAAKSPLHVSNTGIRARKAR